MVLDTSAVVAILLNEPERRAFDVAVAAESRRLMAAPTLVELAMVIEGRFGPAGGHRLDRWLAEAGIEIVPFTREQAELARGAFRRYGKGRHPAGLNYGDCFAYALAKATGEPLLFKGEDFRQTDVTPAA
jgi:ribonuclease VapC